MNVYVNVTYVTVVLKVNTKNVECLCECYTTIVLKVNTKNLEWDECLCKCYICDSCSQSKKGPIRKILSEMNVYVNVTYVTVVVLKVNKDLYEKSWMRWMFM
jgi:hypothetical protein